MRMTLASLLILTVAHAVHAETTPAECDKALLSYLQTRCVRCHKHYGVEEAFAAARQHKTNEREFIRVTLPSASHRGGLLTQASILSLTSDGVRHRPVQSGVWLSEAIFGKSPPPPSANVDHLGLAFESYDAIGRWRTQEVTDGVGENPTFVSYGLRRTTSFADRDERQKIAAASKAKDYRLQDLVEAFVCSYLVQLR